MRKPTFSMSENEDADQLRSNRAIFRSSSLGGGGGGRGLATKIVGPELGMIDPITHSA